MTTSPAFQSQDALKPLPFDPSKLTGLSERMIRSHWENNYGGSVKALAAVKARLVQAAGDKDLPPYIYNDRADIDVLVEALDGVGAVFGSR